MQRLTIGEIDKINSLYSSHRSLRKVAKILNRSPNTIKKYLHDQELFYSKKIVESVNDEHKIAIGTIIGLWMGDGSSYYDKGYSVKIASDKRLTELNKFIARLFKLVFGRNATICNEKKTNRCHIKISSKFVSKYVDSYVVYEPNNKTYSIRLKEEISNYSSEFLEGVLLGLSLSDEHIKNNFLFNVTSKLLSKDVQDILVKQHYSPKLYIHKREKYGWNDLYMLRLNRSQSLSLKCYLEKLSKN